MDLAGIAGEENQMVTNFSLSLSLMGRRASASFSDMKETAKKERLQLWKYQSVTPEELLPFVSNPWHTMFTSSLL